MTRTYCCKAGARGSMLDKQALSTTHSWYCSVSQACEYHSIISHLSYTSVRRILLTETFRQYERHKRLSKAQDAA